MDFPSAYSAFSIMAGEIIKAFLHHGKPICSYIFTGKMRAVARSLIEVCVGRKSFTVKLVLFCAGKFGRLRSGVNFHLAEAIPTDSAKPTLNC